MSDTHSAAQAVRTILLGTDFSPAANAATAWATALARRHGARLHVVHALQLYGPPSDFLVSPPDLTDQIQAAAVARLDGLVQPLTAQGVETTQELRLGAPHAAVIEAASAQNADLVVVGTRGATGLEHLLLGSTAERIVARAKCPVLAVHPDQQPPEAGPGRVLVPTDFSENAARALAAALRLLTTAGGPPLHLILLHAFYLPIEYTAYGTIPTSPRYLDDVAGAAEKRLAELAVSLTRADLEVETVASEGYPPEVVVAQAKALHADVIAMGTHGRSGLEHLLLGSTAERVVQRSPCPVLTLRR